MAGNFVSFFCVMLIESGIDKFKVETGNTDSAQSKTGG